MGNEKSVCDPCELMGDAGFLSSLIINENTEVLEKLAKTVPLNHSGWKSFLFFIIGGSIQPNILKVDKNHPNFKNLGYSKDYPRRNFYSAYRYDMQMDRCEFLKQFLEITNIDVNFVFPKYQETSIFTCKTLTPLSLALFAKGQPRLALTLLEHGANVDKKEELLAELHEKEKNIEKMRLFNSKEKFTFEDLGFSKEEIEEMTSDDFKNEPEAMEGYRKTLEDIKRHEYRKLFNIWKDENMENAR